MKHILIGLFIIGSVCFAQDSGARGSNRFPNIVFILIDDLRYDTFGHMEHPFIQTPHIDKLAQGGMRFTNAFVTTSLCSPSRASFLTGRYMHNHKVVDNSSLMDKNTQTFPQLLQQADYKTAFIGKWHMGGSSDAARPGFHHWVSFRGQGTYKSDGQRLNVNGAQIARTKYMTDELTDYATQWLSEQTADQPFMLYLSHKGVHGLYDPAPRHRDEYRTAVYSPPSTLADTTENKAGKPMWVQDQRNSWHGVEYPYHGRAKQSLDEMYRHYCEMILSVDDSVGRVMETLKTADISRDTLVLFTSDGGHLWGEHGLIDKRCAYEESIRIPLLAYWPSQIKPNSLCEALVANIDIAPTVLEVAELDIPTSIDGHSLLSLLENENNSDWQRDSLLYEYYWEPAFPQTPTTFALRNQQYKLIQYHGLWDTDELYNISTDPRETNNLIESPEQTQRLAQMRQSLHRRLEQTNGLMIPLGIKRNHGSNRRISNGSQRAEFPPTMIAPSSN
jgi:N-acetylglucosamine-6-sulfatase